MQGWWPFDKSRFFGRPNKKTGTDNFLPLTTRLNGRHLFARAASPLLASAIFPRYKGPKRKPQQWYEQTHNYNNAGPCNRSTSRSHSSVGLQFLKFSSCWNFVNRLSSIA